MCVAGSKKQRNVNLESIVMRCGYIISLMLISINYISKQTICVSHAKNIERQETHLRNLLLLFFFCQDNNFIVTNFISKACVVNFHICEFANLMHYFAEEVVKETIS